MTHAGPIRASFRIFARALQKTNSLSTEVGKLIARSLELLMANPPGEETNSGRQTQDGEMDPYLNLCI